MIDLKLSPVEASMLKAVALAKGTVRETPKKTKTPTYNLTVEQIESLKRKAVDDAVATAWVLMLGLPVMALTDKHGFTPEQVDKLIDDVLDLHDSYEKGYLSLQDIHTALKEEAGIVIQEKQKKRRKYK